MTMDQQHSSIATENGTGSYQYKCSLLPQCKKSAKEVNLTLNLNLGLQVDPMNPRLRRFLKLLSNFFQLFEEYFFRRWENIPLRWRQHITFMGWSVYFPVHKYLLGKRTGIHRDASYEYHALTTLLYWGRLFPVTIRQMRFSLSQLCVWHPPSAYPYSKPMKKIDTSRRSRYNNQLSETEYSVDSTGCEIPSLKIQCSSTKCEIDGVSANVLQVCHDMVGTKLKLSDRVYSRDDGFVTGFYLQHGTEPSDTVIFWLYGGAFLSGDSKGNVNIAEKIGQSSQYSDVFLPNYRLLPEHSFHDALHDVLQSYEYLITVRSICPSKVILLGVSSGGGLILRLLQTLIEYINSMTSSTNTTDDSSGKCLFLNRMPMGAVLMSPFVDYTEPTGSFVEYTAHDLIVNQSVFEIGVPYFDKLGTSITRHNESPLYRSLKGLPPICVVVSEHETCFDQVMMLYKKALVDSVEVEMAVWRYMCHVFPLLSAFVPEGKEAVNFICEWMNHRILKSKFL